MKKPYITILFITLLAVIWFEKSYSKDNKKTDEEALKENYYKHFEINDAKRFFPEAEKLKTLNLKKGNLDEYYRAWGNEVLFYVNNKNLHSAISEAGKMRIDATNLNNKFGLALSSYDLGVIYEISKDNLLAKKYYHESIRIMKLFHDDSKLAPLYNRLASLYIETNPKTADSLLTMAIDMASDYNSKFDCYSQECYMGLTTDDADRFYKYYAKCMFIENEYNNQIVPEWIAYLDVIKLYFDKKYTDALSKTTHINDIIDRHHIRYYIYKKMGNSDMALKEMELTHKYEESSRAVADNEDFIAITHEMDNAKMQKERQQMQNKMRNITYSIFTFLLLGMITLLHYLFINKKRELKKTNKQNEELRLARVQAEASEKMKLEFIENMSHEIRTPLNAISGFSQLIASGALDADHEIRNNMSARVTDNVKRLTDIIDNVLELSSVKSNSSDSDIEPINCNSFCKAAFYDLTEGKKDNVELLFTSNVPNDWTLTTSKNNLLLAIGKIITNACKFTNEGCIHMHCDMSANRKNFILSISDTGPGIPKDKAEVIFDKFVKLDNFMPGTGLGLTACRYMIKRIGGNVILDTDYKQGCKFVITIPFKLEE